jgi:hypothetical protein
VKRYQVTIKRDVIIYALTRAEAGQKALALWNRTMNESLAVHPLRVAAVKRLPSIEKEAHGPLIDNAPARETRQ